jgi:hypothetical protein
MCGEKSAAYAEHADDNIWLSNWPSNVTAT